MDGTIAQRLADVVEARGHGDKLDALWTLARAAVLLTEAGPAPAVLGGSRVGGGPDLAEGVGWPRDRDGFHLNLLAQLDLSTCASFETGLPRAGLLSFFIGCEGGDGRVLYAPPDAPLVAHALAKDAETIAAAARGMTRWDSGAKRFVLSDEVGEGGLTARSDAAGVIDFFVDGAPVVALASDYDCAVEAMALAASATMAMPAPESLWAGLDPDAAADLMAELEAALRIGTGPQHMLAGLPSKHALSGESSPRARAARHAEALGWGDLVTPAAWQPLLVLRSGGAAGFSFMDHDDMVYLVPKADLAKRDFSRAFAGIVAS